MKLMSLLKLVDTQRVHGGVTSFCFFQEIITDRPTDQRTDQPTDGYEGVYESYTLTLNKQWINQCCQLIG